MSERDVSKFLDFEDPREDEFVAEALARQGIQAELTDVNAAAHRSSPRSQARARLLVQPEDRARAEELFVELPNDQFLKGLGGSCPGYSTPLAEFRREVRMIRWLHRAHITSSVAVLVIITTNTAADVFHAASMPCAFEVVSALAFLGIVLSLVGSAWSKCRRCKKMFHYRLVLFTIFETQGLSCGFHLWNDDGI